MAESIVKIPRLRNTDDFVAFSFGNKHSLYDFGVYRVINGDRYNEGLAPNISDQTVDIPGNEGLYYFNSWHKQKDFEINIAFDHLTEGKLREMKRWLNGKELQDLWFSETPYKVYTAKVVGSPVLNIIPFEENGQRIYKGEGIINFTAYWPYARTPDFVQYYEVLNNRNLSISNADGLLSTNGGFVELYWSDINGNVISQISEWSLDYSIEDEDYSIPAYDDVVQTGFCGTNVPSVSVDISSSEAEISNYVKVVFNFVGTNLNAYRLFADYNDIAQSGLTNSTDVNKGENPGDLPSPFILTQPGLCRKGAKFSIGELEIELNEDCYDLEWNSKTGIVKGKNASTDNTKRLVQYSGISVGAIPTGGLDEEDISGVQNITIFEEVLVDESWVGDKIIDTSTKTTTWPETRIINNNEIASLGSDYEEADRSIDLFFPTWEEVIKDMAENENYNVIYSGSGFDGSEYVGPSYLEVNGAGAYYIGEGEFHRLFSIVPGTFNLNENDQGVLDFNQNSPYQIIKNVDGEFILNLNTSEPVITKTEENTQQYKITTSEKCYSYCADYYWTENDNKITILDELKLNLPISVSITTAVGEEPIYFDNNGEVLEIKLLPTYFEVSLEQVGDFEIWAKLAITRMSSNVHRVKMYKDDYLCMLDFLLVYERSCGELFLLMSSHLHNNDDDESPITNASLTNGVSILASEEQIWSCPELSIATLKMIEEMNLVKINTWATVQEQDRVVTYEQEKINTYNYYKINKTYQHTLENTEVSYTEGTAPTVIKTIKTNMATNTSEEVAINNTPYPGVIENPYAGISLDYKYWYY